MDKTIKIVLAILFLLCLADMPYGFYQLVRIAGLLGFTILAYLTKQQGRQTEVIVYVALALLFQPFFKIALGRELWNIIDLIVALLLILSIFIEAKQYKEVKAKNEERLLKKNDSLQDPIIKKK